MSEFKRGDRVTLNEEVHEWSLYASDGSVTDFVSGPHYGEAHRVRAVGYCPTLECEVLWLEGFPGNSLDDAFQSSEFKNLEDDESFLMGYNVGYSEARDEYL